MELEIKTSTIVKIAAVVLAAWLLYAIHNVLIVLFLAVMISSAIHPFAKYLGQYRVPRILSVVIIYAIFFGLLVLLASQVVPLVSFEIEELTAYLPQFVDSISDVVSSLPGENVSATFWEEVQGLLDTTKQYLQDNSFTDIVINIFGGVVWFVATLVLAFYLSIMPYGTSSFIRSILPDQYEDYVIRLWKKSERKVGRWFQAQILLALSVGLLVYVGLLILDVKYALILALIAMVLEVVPVAGPIIAAVPAIALAFTESGTMVLWVIVLYTIIQQIESSVLTPLIMGKTIGLNPVTVIIAVLIGGTVAGILGIIISVPIAVVIVEIIDDLAEEKERRQKERELAKQQT